MTCDNCDPKKSYPGKLIKTTPDLKHCSICGDQVMPIQALNLLKETDTKRWDRYFYGVCVAIANKSSCLSRQIGAILVRDKSIVSTGYNGSARGYPHCKDKCPRQVKGYKSGEGLNECPAAHAEANCIANAARIGASTISTTLYLNAPIPCKDCSTILVNAGIIEIVSEKLEWYHEMSKGILDAANVRYRKFIL